MDERRDDERGREEKHQGEDRRLQDGPGEGRREEETIRVIMMRG